MAVFAIVALLCFFTNNIENLSAQTPPDSSTEYPAVKDIRAGIWNDGQAALWDLNIIDHFRFFGPAERLRGFKPTQPINFSHPIHVQKNKMECQFCHWNAAKSSYVAIPEVETCVGCHKFVEIPGAAPMAMGVTGSSDAGKAEIKKIHEYFIKKEPIPWVKVHVMPDYVKFNHKRHIKAGVTCQSCHGQVPQMDQVERVSTMKMGWCISCHRDQGTSIDCYACHR